MGPASTVGNTGATHAGDQTRQSPTEKGASERNTANTRGVRTGEAYPGTGGSKLRMTSGSRLRVPLIRAPPRCHPLPTLRFPRRLLPQRGPLASSPTAKLSLLSALCQSSGRRYACLLLPLSSSFSTPCVHPSVRHTKLHFIPQRACDPSIVANLDRQTGLDKWRRPPTAQEKGARQTQNTAVAPEGKGHFMNS